MAFLPDGAIWALEDSGGRGGGNGRLLKLTPN